MPAKFGIAALIMASAPILIFYALYVHDKRSTWQTNSPESGNVSGCLSYPQLFPTRHKRF